MYHTAKAQLGGYDVPCLLSNPLKNLIVVLFITSSRYLSMPTLSPLLQSLDLSGSNLPGNGLGQLLSALTQRKRLSSSSQQHSLKLSLCQCGIQGPLPKLDAADYITVVTNSLMLLKAKQFCTDKFVVMLELYGNDNLCKSQLESWTQFS